MPALPLIDLLILLGSATLAVAFVEKAIHLTTHYRPIFDLFSMTPMDFLFLSVACFVFAGALAGRTWVRLNEGRLQVLRGQRAVEAARHRLEAASVEAGGAGAAGITPIHAEKAGADRR